MIHSKIALVDGSLRRDSFSRQLGHAVATLAPPGFSFHEVRVDNLPLYNQDDDAAPAESVKRLKKEIQGFSSKLDGLVHRLGEQDQASLRRNP